jgi:hypothetical protein
MADPNLTAEIFVRRSRQSNHEPRFQSGRPELAAAFLSRAACCKL